MAEEALFEKKNILVTGGVGFIGSFLCERLLQDNHRVVCVDNFITSQQINIEHLLKNPDFEFIKANINEGLDLESYPELERFKLKFQGFQEIYHMACPTSAKKFDQFKMDTLLANSVGMRNVLEIAAKWKAKFFQASTSVIYGMRPEDNHLLKEDEFGPVDHLTPRGCYDEGKRWAETMANTYADVHGIDVRIARIFRTYGPRMALYDGHMIPDFIVDALDGKDFTIYGDDGFRTSLTYVTDMIDGILRVMNAKENPGVVNLGSDYDIKIIDVAQKILEMTDSTVKINYEEPLPFMRDLGLPDLTKAKELGWIPLVRLEQGLQKSIEYTIAHKGLVSPSLGG